LYRALHFQLGACGFGGQIYGIALARFFQEGELTDRATQLKRVLFVRAVKGKFPQKKDRVLQRDSALDGGLV